MSDDRRSTADMTPLVTTFPAAGPPSPLAMNGQFPASYAPDPVLPPPAPFPGAAYDRPAEPEPGRGFSPLPPTGGAPDHPPATVQFPATDARAPASAGRHRGQSPSPDADGMPAKRGRSRRGLIIGIAVAFVVLAAGGATAAAFVWPKHAKQPAAAASTQQSTPAQAPTTASTGPTGTKAGPTQTPIVAGPAGWTYPKPIDQQAYQNNNADIKALSCVSAVQCYAVDSGGNILASKAMNSWQTVATDGQNTLTSISCTSAQFCAAVDNSGSAVIYSNGTWSDPVSIDSGNGLTSVSCASSTYCVAVDNQGNAFTFTGVATQWSRAPLDPNQGNNIASISCPDTSFCAAADQSGDTYTYNGTSWTPADNIDNGNQFVQVSCYSATFCMAVDNNGNAAVLTNGGWSIGSMPSTATGVSCPAAGYCVAVDGNGGALVYQQAGWSKVSKVDGNNTFAAISCVGVNTCAAADQYDNVMYYTAPPSQ